MGTNHGTVRPYAAYTRRLLSGGYQYSRVLSKIGSTMSADMAVPTKMIGSAGPCRYSLAASHQINRPTTMSRLPTVNTADGMVGLAWIGIISDTYVTLLMVEFPVNSRSKDF